MQPDAIAIEPKFILSYAGASVYAVDWQKKVRVSVRKFAQPFSWSDNKILEADAAYVGTVSFDGFRDSFPGPEIMEMFPGYVAARYNYAEGRVEYQGIPPVTHRERNYLWAAEPKRIADAEMARLMAEYEAKWKKEEAR